MRCTEAGHKYLLEHLDGDGLQELVFVKREGEGYPGNIGHHEGTNLQEVYRVLINRIQYLNMQVADGINLHLIESARCSIIYLELRAAARHGRKHPDFWDDVENQPVCTKCGHIGCEGSC